MRRYTAPVERISNVAGTAVMSQNPSVESSPLPVLSVAELTESIKLLLESGFPSVWVSGEISNFSRPQSGHCYFTLKDDAAQIRAVIWRNVATRARFELHDGLEVVCQGSLEVYGPRGTYQLVVRQVEPRGLGPLELALRRLREKLAAEGLFAAERKRPIPRFPQRIAVVTSPTGAAIRDFLQVATRRWQGADVLVVPVRVQGEGAAQEIAAAIATVNQLADRVDCLVVARGGGSLEDLWAFNEEVVVRAIHASRVPVVSGIGHEIDVTLADLVADKRALTPSEAAELVSPDRQELLGTLRSYRQRLLAGLRARASARRARLDAISSHRRFRRPYDLIHERAQRLDDLSARLLRAVRQRLAAARAVADRIGGRIESLNPRGVLARGYSLTERAADGQLVRDAAQLRPGDRLVTRFGRGQATSTVDFVREADQ